MTPTDKPKNPPMMEPYTKEWEREADQLARSYCPPIHPCRECGGPVVDGYCCQRCGSANP